MATGDETRAQPFADRGRPDGGGADETTVVNNPIPPRPAHRGQAAPGGHGGPGAFAAGGPGGGQQAPRPEGGPGLFDDGLARTGAGPQRQVGVGGAPDPGGPGRPRILANQASEWEQNLQEMEVVRSRRPGLILLFLVALLVVAVIALALAALSVLRGGDDTASDGDVVAAGDEATSDTTVFGEGTDTTVESTTSLVDPNAVRITLAEDPFVCDGGTREFALLGNLEPNETVQFSSPQSPNLRDGQADVNGELPVRWQCDPTQAGTTWEITATGATSARTLTFLLAGVAAPAGAEPTALTVVVTEDPFACDGATREFARISGAEPNETVQFSSPQSPNLRDGEADDNGELPVRWQCDSTQAGTTWELTATGATSGRSVTFSVTGS